MYYIFCLHFTVHFNHISIFKMADFKNLGILFSDEVWTTKMHRYTWSISCRGISLVRFSRWLLSAILHFFESYFDHPQRLLNGLWYCAKFGCDRCSSFDNVKVAIFGMFGFKMPIHAPKIVFFWRFDPQRHILAWVCIVWAIMRENLPMGLTCRWVPQKGFKK